MFLNKIAVTLSVCILSIAPLKASSSFCGDLLEEKPATTYITEQEFHNLQEDSIKRMHLEDMPTLTMPHIYRCRHSSNSFTPITFLGTDHPIPLSFFSSSAQNELLQADELYVEDARPLKVFYSKDPLPWSKELPESLLQRGKAVLKVLGYDENLISHLEIQSLINVMSRETYFWGMDTELVKIYYTLRKPIYSLDEDINRENEFADFLKDTRTSIEENILQLKQAEQSEQLKEAIKKLEQRLEDSYKNPEISLLKEFCLPLIEEDYYSSMKSFHEAYWEGSLPSDDEDNELYQMPSRNQRFLNIILNSIEMKPLKKKLYVFGFDHIRDILDRLYKESDIIIERLNCEGNFETFSLT